MRVETLLSPGLIARGLQLRAMAAQAISTVEITAGRTPGGKINTAKTLQAFFSDCASKLSSYVDSVLPTFASALIASGQGTKLAITMSEDMDPTVVPAGSAFTTSPAKTVSAVSVQGKIVTLTVSAAFVPGAVTVAYTQPGTNALRDLSGNLLATFTAQTVTNNLP
jgi:hypothetical protein